MTPQLLRILTRPDAAQLVARPRIIYSRRKDIAGFRFGRLVAIEDAGCSRGLERGRVWLCKCDCGERVFVRLRHLVSRNTRSCGCLRVEINRRLGPQQRHHFRG